MRAGDISELLEGTTGETKRIFLLSEDNDIFMCSSQSTSLQFPLALALEIAVTWVTASF